MDTFDPLPIDLFSDSILEEDPSKYFSLSQFDMELQQQAQEAISHGNWQDFDKYLPLDNQAFNFRNDQAQPIFMPSNLSYEPVLPEQPKNLFDNMLNWENNQQNIIKQEYASPESLPYSPPQQNTKQPLDVHLFQSPNSDDSIKLDTSPVDFLNSVSPLSFISSNTNQNKVPIERLRTNSIITNAVNSTLNNSSSGGRQHKKTAHNAIERRYRNNINDRITELKNAVPALLYAKVKDNSGKRSHRDDSDEGEDGEEYLDGVAIATKLNKATILKKATEYINHLKKQGEEIRLENETLQRILNQLPGGPNILKQYHIQKEHREKDLQQKVTRERELAKLQEQQRKAANRKRARYNKQNGDEYESPLSSPGSTDPPTPPSVSNRVFMAIFMCVTFFSTSPLTSTDSSNSYQNAHHYPSEKIPIPADTGADENIISQASIFDTSLGSIFKFDDTWSTIRTIFVIICTIHFVFPYIRYALFFSPKVKKTNWSKRNSFSLNKSKKEIALTNTVGDLKNQHIQTILEKSIKNEGNENLPQTSLTTVFPLIKEIFYFFCHHVIGYDVLYGSNNPEKEWARVCKWVKLNEIRCITGDTRMSALYCCLRMTNLVDVLDEEIHEDAHAIYARAYATATMQMSFIIPDSLTFLRNRVSKYFWSCAEGRIRYLEDEEDEKNVWIQALSWTDQEHDPLLQIRTSPAWAETMAILKNTSSLSFNAPVIVPVEILTSFHLMDRLYDQFSRLAQIMNSPFDAKNGNLELGFYNIMLLTKPEQEKYGLVHWLSVVGIVAEAIWKNKGLIQAEKYLSVILEETPEAISSSASNVSQRSRLNQVDEIVKKSMAHVLSGAFLIKQKPDQEQQASDELSAIEALYSLNRKSSKQSNDILESNVMVLAEFVVSLLGLEAIMTIEGEEKKAQKLALHLRRMVRLIKGDHNSIVERLSRVGRVMGENSESVYDLSDEEDQYGSFIKRSDKAQLILRGLA